MKRLRLTSFSLRFPRLVIGVSLAAVIFFGAQFPKVKFDNDPENMLAQDEAIRVFHNQVKAQYNLYDFVIVGVVNTEDADGIFNVGTLQRIDALTRELITLHQSEDGRPVVIRNGEPYQPELESASGWNRALAKVFGNDVNRLFNEAGEPAIIASEIISPGVVDNIKQAAQGQLAIEYLMEQPPQSREEALAIRRDAFNNPLYKGTLVSEDGAAIAIYIPIIAKTYSYNVANLVARLTEDWTGNDQVYITGQPVAQDTFGVEMLVQMATSAPLAGVVIFLLLLFFFRRLSLVIAPMIVAIISVVSTMGLLIGLGYDVHIMSSMIAIFLMPISVADSVHILSEFFDSYPRFKDKAVTIKHVISHLFKPMLYTSLTTIAGFASLATTPIPPVRVFGLHVAFGVALAWLLTMTLVPAYIMIFVRTGTLDRLNPEQKGHEPPRRTLLGRYLNRLGQFSYSRWKVILGVTLLIIAVSISGIVRIRVNDNPVKWFTQNHRIRVADRVLNDHFGGTYTAYLTLKAGAAEVPSSAARLAGIRDAALGLVGGSAPEGERAFADLLDQSCKQLAEGGADEEQCFAELVRATEALDQQLGGAWNALGEVINYLEPEGLTLEKIAGAVADQGSRAAREMLMVRIREFDSLQGAALHDKALEIVDQNTALRFTDLLFQARAAVTAPTFKRPDNLAYIAELQAFLATLPSVGKSSSAVDALKKASYELNYDAQAAEADNVRFYRIPPDPAAVGQVFAQLEGMKKKESLFHLVTKDYNEVNLWVQLKSGDNTEMQAVVDNVEQWMRENPAPVALKSGWAGLTYLNVVWQDKMVAGMLSALLSSFVVVLIMMVVLFRSLIFGLMAMLPLSVTILFIYGLIGLAGKDYDMPVAVLSSLTLGLSVDFAIHFLERSRELARELGSWRAAVGPMFQEPAKAISRNAVIISVGFTPLLFAPLVPYRTVGFFLATIMAVSWIGTLLILTAVMTALQRSVLKDMAGEKQRATADQQKKGSVE